MENCDEEGDDKNKRKLLCHVMSSNKMSANSQQFQSAIFLSHEKIMDAMATISASLHFLLGNIFFCSEDFDNGLIYSFDIRVYLHFLK
jgi:hypothetical protein